MRNGKEIAEEINQMPMAMTRIDWAKDTEFERDVLRDVMKTLRIDLLDIVRQWILQAWEEALNDNSSICIAREENRFLKWEHHELDSFLNRHILLRHNRRALEAATTEKFAQKPKIEVLKDIMRQGVGLEGVPGVTIKVDDLIEVDDEDVAQAVEAQAEALEVVEQEELEGEMPLHPLRDAVEKYLPLIDTKRKWFPFCVTLMRKGWVGKGNFNKCKKLIEEAYDLPLAKRRDIDAHDLNSKVYLGSLKKWPPSEWKAGEGEVFKREKVVSEYIDLANKAMEFIPEKHKQ